MKYKFEKKTRYINAMKITFFTENYKVANLHRNYSV